jgi:hypothetical protein
VRECTLSLAVHGILVAAMFVGPRYWIDRIEVQPSNYTQLISTTAGLGSNAQLSAAHGNVAAKPRKLVVPMPIPNQVEASRQQAVDKDVVAEMEPDGAEAITAAGQGPAPHAQLGSAYPEITNWPEPVVDEGAQLGSAFPEITHWPEPVMQVGTRPHISPGK